MGCNMKRSIFLFFVLLLSLPSSAARLYLSPLGRAIPNSAIFIKSESNNTDIITSIGVEMMKKSNYSNFGFVFTSALGVAEVTSKNAVQENFITWDNGVKFGYFNRLFVYGEVGIELFELGLRSFSEERNSQSHSYRYNNNYNYDNNNSNSTDGYAGIGIGYNFKPVKIELYSRARQIDGNNWESRKHIFSGIQLSFSF